MQYTDTHPGQVPAAAPSNGSRTHTLTNDATRDLENEDESEAPRIVGTLKLRGAHSKKKQGKAKVAWDEDVVDNEGCGKKKSKSSSCSTGPVFYSDLELVHSLLYLSQTSKI
jgi:protein phosphatase 1 regulatory subunit 11